MSRLSKAELHEWKVAVRSAPQGTPMTILTLMMMPKQLAKVCFREMRKRGWKREVHRDIWVKP